ncbi:MAG TPA: nuclear transport factor 2 family protein [Caulobacteraceae bacterium]|nr:nuclear transport factor 2 family protein [Caulobacteraceae bacterium]
MDDTDRLFERYVAMWNEPNAEIRRRLIDDLWTEGGAHFVRDLEYRGHEQLEERVKSAHERFVGTGEHTFVGTEALKRGNGVRVRWRMVTRKDGTDAGGGCDFLVLADDGRIAADYQFPEPA